MRRHGFNRNRIESSVFQEKKFVADLLSPDGVDSLLCDVRGYRSGEK